MSDEFRINPVCLGTSVTALRKRLYLCGRHLAGRNTFCLQKCPELPFLAASRLKADDGIPFSGKDRNQLFETMKKGGADRLENEVIPEGSDVAHHPVTDPGRGQRRGQ